MQEQDRNSDIDRLCKQVECLEKLLEKFGEKRESDKHQIENLKEQVHNLTQANAMEHSISSGFAAITEQLKPLRELTPPRESLSPESAARLEKVRVALARPRWRASNFEIEQDNSVPANQRQQRSP